MVTLQYYRPQLGARFNGNPIYIDYSTDVVVLDDPYCFSAVEALYDFNDVEDTSAAGNELLHFRDNIRSLVLDIERIGPGKTIDFVGRMKNLVSLTMPQELSASYAKIMPWGWRNRDTEVPKMERSGKSGRDC